MANVKKETEDSNSVGEESTDNMDGNGQEAAISSYVEDPLYAAFVDAYQKGDWKESEEKLNKLIVNYPIENELRHLHQDLALRSSVDEIEVVENKQDRKKFRIKMLQTIVGLAVVITLLVIGYGLSASWISTQRSAAEERVQQITQEISLNRKYDDARSLIQAEKYEEALSLLEGINAIDPDYPNLGEKLAEAENLMAIDARYEEALSLKDDEEGLSALEIFREIALETPFFKDIEAQIGELEREYLLGGLLSSGDNAYDGERWLDAIDNYEKALAIEADLEALGVEERLFNSYIRGAEYILTSEELSLEDLEVAEGYFRASLSLRPQNKEALERRAGVNDSISGLLAAGYIQAAQSFLVDQADSLEALDNASIYFGKALTLNPDAAEIRLQFNLARSYLSANSDFRNGLWNSAITNLEFIYGTDQSYAEGTAEQMLYEAYGARGNGFLTVGNFESALDDFQNAALIATGDPDAALRLFEAQVNVAYVLGRLGSHRDAVNLYQAAIQDSGLIAKLTEEDEEVANALIEGERAAARRDYRAAYVWYSDALRGNTEVFSIERYTVVDGDYLAKLARKFNSTVQAIIDANNLSYPYYIIPGQILLIPAIK